MERILYLILTIIILAISCNKDDLSDFQKDENGVIVSLSYIWIKSLHKDNTFHSNGYVEFPVIYDENILIPTTDSNGNQYLSMINTSDGETKWKWNDILEETFCNDVELYGLFKQDNLLTWQKGSRSYCINLENGTTIWKVQRDKTYDSRINSYGNDYFTYSLITNTEGYDEQVAYTGNIQTGELTEFLRANLSGDYIAPSSENGGVGGIIYINEILLNSNLLLVTYAEPLPEWCVNSFFGLYNTQIQEWVYERKLLVPPLWNTSVFHTPIIYNGQVYANVGNNIVCHDLYTGEQLWRREFDNDFLFSGFIIEEDKIIANNENKTLYCLDTETGHSIWEGEGAGTSSRMSYLNGIVYFVGGSDGKLHAVDIDTGQTVWRLDAKKIEGSESLFKTNAVYVIPGENSEKGKVIALTHMYAYCFEAYR